MSRAEKIYANSPKMERDGETGKMKVSRPEPKAKGPDAEVAGTSGYDMYEKQAKERLDLFLKHEKEHFGKMSGGLSKEVESKESKGSGAGEEKIKKIEQEKE